MIRRNTSYDQYHRKDEAFQKVLSKITGNWKVPARISKEEAWNNLLIEIEKKKTIPVKTFRMVKITAFAATFLLAVAVSWFLYTLKTTEYISMRGENKTILLPDRSVVLLNAESTVYFYPNKWKNKREVFLSGEAFFEVEKGKKFTVRTANGVIDVLGTKFNVRSRGNELKVYCASGKVRVTKNREVILVKGEQCISRNSNEISKPVRVDTSVSASWIRGEFWFTNDLLSEVFEEIERQFNVDILYDDSKPRFYTGYFNKDDLNEALVNVCEPMSLTFKIMDNKILIES